MRLFTAIALPDSVKGDLASIQPNHSGIRLTPESQIHLTLRFIGETEKAKTRRIVQALSYVAFRPFEITLKGTGTFPGPSNPSVLWAGVQYHPVLRELYDAMQEELYRSGISSARRTYHPHVTLGRVRENRRKPAGDSTVQESPLQVVLKDFLHGEASRFQISFPVNSFSLYHSRLHSGGAIHHTLQEYGAS